MDWKVLYVLVITWAGRRRENRSLASGYLCPTDALVPTEGFLPSGRDVLADRSMFPEGEWTGVLRSWQAFGLGTLQSIVWTDSDLTADDMVKVNWVNDGSEKVAA